MVLSKQILNGLKLILLIVSLASVQIGFSQNLVTGQVTEAASGQSLPGANIIIKGTEKGTQSNVDGFFTIQASKDDILLVSYLGFVDQEISCLPLVFNDARHHVFTDQGDQILLAMAQRDLIADLIKVTGVL